MLLSASVVRGTSLFRARGCSEKDNRRIGEKKLTSLCGRQRWPACTHCGRLRRPRRSPGASPPPASADLEGVRWHLVKERQQTRLHRGGVLAPRRNAFWFNAMRVRQAPLWSGRIGGQIPTLDTTKHNCNTEMQKTCWTDVQIDGDTLTLCIENMSLKGIIGADAHKYDIRCSAPNLELRAVGCHNSTPGAPHYG